jgi:hypothetical protein
MSKKVKVKVPKRIAGVKIPKTVRKGPIAQFLNSSAGQMLLAEALVLAAGAFTVKGAARAMTPAGRKTTLARGSEKLSYAFSEAVQAFRNALTEDSSDGVEVQTASDSVKKKQRASRADASSTPH